MLRTCKKNIIEVIMDIYSVIDLFGGLALFLYGMSTLGNGLEKASSGRMEKILENLTSNIFKSVALGALVTAAVQSSSATTVIVVGLVNAGILKLSSAVGVIMGANIGTTVTGQLLRLGDVKLNFLKPTVLAPVVAVIGILMYMIAKRSKFKNIGEILIGFGILFNGMFAMEAAVSGLKDVPAFSELFMHFSNPILGVLLGTLVTAVIQSSSASVGILQALSSTGAITYSTAFPIIMGQNIGTCITPLLSSIGANKNAKRTAMVHLYFNIIGTVFFLLAVYAIQYTIGFSFWDEPINRGGIADFHTLFNIIVTLCFIPFHKVLEKLACWTIRNTEKETEQLGQEDSSDILDERFLVSPSLAIQQTMNTVVKLGTYAQYNFREVRQLVHKFDLKACERINENENTIDKLEDRLNNYILKLNDCELIETENRNITTILHLTSEFERIGDYAINIMESTQALFEKNINFSQVARKELSIVFDAIDEIIDFSIKAIEPDNFRMVANIEPLEETVDYLVETLKSKHIDRLKTGACTVEAGVKFLDILTNLERISDHCSNVGVYLIIRQSRDDNLNRHEYIQALHDGESQSYQELIKLYQKKYTLSE